LCNAEGAAEIRKLYTDVKLRGILRRRIGAMARAMLDTVRTPVLCQCDCNCFFKNESLERPSALFGTSPEFFWVRSPGFWPDVTLDAHVTFQDLRKSVESGSGRSSNRAHAFQIIMKGCVMSGSVCCCYSYLFTLYIPMPKVNGALLPNNARSTLWGGLLSHPIQLRRPA
jgi:hypothetical protein